MGNFIKVTEQASRYNDLEKMSIQEILTNINQEDKTVPDAVEKAIPQIEKTGFCHLADKMLQGGRLILYGSWH
jgi:N-acetylmuramic acid 6-phosphate etherase